MSATSTGRVPALVFPSDLPQDPEVLPADLGLVDELLRDRGALLARVERGEDLTRLARAMIVTIAVCGAAFGAAAGLHRGGVQVALAALKLPAALLLTAAICAPVLTSLNAVLLGRSDVKRDLALVLSCLGIASLVAAALTPLVLMAGGSPTMGYHRMILVTVACASMGGAAGLALFVRSLRRYAGREERWFVGATVLTVFALVGAQTTWTFRPYVSVPGSPVVVMHPVQGSFLDAVVRTAYTAAGIRVNEMTEPPSTSGNSAVLHSPVAEPPPPPADAAAAPAREATLPADAAPVRETFPEWP